MSTLEEPQEGRDSPMITEIRWHGRGGQGTVTVAKLLASAAMREGKYFQAFPEYGPERRGAPLQAFTRISDTVIDEYCHVTTPGIVVVLDTGLIGNVPFTAGVTEDCVLVANYAGSPAELRDQLGFRVGRVVTVDATGIALRRFGRAITNTPMLGALIRATGVVQLENALAEVVESFAGKLSAEAIESNKSALLDAFNSANLSDSGKEGPSAEPAVATKPGWKELPWGAVLPEAGSAAAYRTGDWRSRRPVFMPEHCINCMLCWIFCPDMSILVEDRKVVGIDYYHCKGCGICARECPAKTKAIMMIDEATAASEPAGAPGGGRR